MKTVDRITILVAAGVISATLAAGTCSTNARVDDVKDHVNARFDDVNARIDDMNARIDDLRQDFRELRALVVDALRQDAAAD